MKVYKISYTQIYAKGEEIDVVKNVLGKNVEEAILKIKENEGRVGIEIKEATIVTHIDS